MGMDGLLGTLQQPFALALFSSTNFSVSLSLSSTYPDWNGNLHFALHSNFHLLFPIILIIITAFLILFIRNNNDSSLYAPFT